jgi:anthranilate phosphoribosyltransferase
MSKTLNSKEFFELLFLNKINANDAKTFLIDIYNKGESATDIINAVKVMKKHLSPLNVKKDLKDKLFDIVGTGGDGSNTFNISSSCAIVLASCGVYVAKHGSRGYTSKSGSADMLEKLGINLNLDIKSQEKLLEETNFTYMFAPNHHKAMRYIAPIRKTISHRTIFNLIGPLANPANATKQLIGVYDENLLDIFASALIEIKTSLSIVVSSKDGLDEISVSDKTAYSKIENNKITKHIFNPKDYGFNLHPKSALIGGDSIENARITYNILSNKIKGAKKDIVIINSAFGLWAYGIAKSIEEGIEISRESIESGNALNKLQHILKVSKQLK